MLATYWLFVRESSVAELFNEHFGHFVCIIWFLRNTKTSAFNSQHNVHKTYMYIFTDKFKQTLSSTAILTVQPWYAKIYFNSITVKSGVLFPPILQHCRQYCNVHALIAPSKLHRKLQVAAISIFTNLLISIFCWQSFADKNTAEQYLVAWQYCYQRKSTRKILK